MFNIQIWTFFHTFGRYDLYGLPPIYIYAHDGILSRSFPAVEMSFLAWPLVRVFSDLLSHGFHGTKRQSVPGPQRISKIVSFGQQFIPIIF